MREGGNKRIRGRETEWATVKYLIWLAVTVMMMLWVESLHIGITYVHA